MTETIRTKPGERSLLASQIAGAFNALNEQEPPEPACPACGGDGWYVAHDDECYDTGDCCCAGEQVRCECQETR